MRFFTATFTVIGALATAVLAAENPITKPDGSEPIVAGKSYTVTWEPTTEGPVTLKLRQGPSTNLKDVLTITTDDSNSGSYTWTPSSSLPAGENYAIQISDASGNVNYTPLLTVDSSASGSAYPSETASETESSSKSYTKTSSGRSTMVTSYSQHNSTRTATTMHHNSTTKASNMTKTASKTKTPSKTTLETSEPTATEDASATASPSDAPTSAPDASDSAAMSVASSPLALIACVIAALAYIN